MQEVNLYNSQLVDVDGRVVDLLNTYTSVTRRRRWILVNVSVYVHHSAISKSVAFTQRAVVYRNVSQQQAKLRKHSPQVNLAPPAASSHELDVVVVTNNQTLLSVQARKVSVHPLLLASAKQHIAQVVHFVTGLDY